jgi:prevent-host-death family protein
MKTEIIDATRARARLGDILARARYGGWRFIIQQRGDPAAAVMGYEDYRALMELLEDFQDARDMLETEKEPARPLREYLAEWEQSNTDV